MASSKHSAESGVAEVDNSCVLLSAADIVPVRFRSGDVTVTIFRETCGIAAAVMNLIGA